MYSFEIIKTQDNKFYAEIFIEKTGYIVRETIEVESKEQAIQDAKNWIEKKIQRDSK